MSIEEPSDEIHKKELVGRRAFGKDKDIFSEEDGHRHYKIGVFTDTRDGGLSVDRLGIGAAEKKRIAYLDPLGVTMGEKRSKDFRGWVQVRVESISELVAATPAVGEDNVFHAEIMRDEDFPTTRAKRAFAYQLCELARKQGFVPSPSYEASSV